MDKVLVTRLSPPSTSAKGVVFNSSSGAGGVRLAGSEGLLFLFLEEDSLEGEEEAEDCWLLWETSSSLSTRVRFLLRLVDMLFEPRLETKKCGNLGGVSC